MKIGVFASFLMVTALSLYIWSPAKESSAFDWTTVDGTSPYLASLSGNNEIKISATPTAAQQIFSNDDTLELNTTCPYGVGVFLNMESGESNSLARIGDDNGTKSIIATTGTSLIDNSWGFSLDDGTTYSPVPLNGTIPATIYTSEQVENHTEINVKYGVKMNSSIPSGRYSNKVVYSIVANESCARYTLHFDTDGGTSIDDMTLTYGQLIDLSDYVTTKDGFDFGGWELTGSVDTAYDGTETDVDVNPGNALSVELKAKWLVSQTSFYSLRTMQAMTPKICAEVTTPDKNATEFDTDGSHAGDTNFIPQVTIRDIRDESEYTIRKLADGRCWMTENLRIGGDEPITLHPEDSNVASDFELPASSTNFNVYDSPVIKVDQNNGGYYNWNAATAGEGINSMTSGNTTHSICPKGWRLPTSGANGEFQTMNVNYNSVSALMGTPGLTASGTADGSGLGSVGLYWSSTASSGSYAYSLRSQTPNTIDPSNNSVKITGLSVRCVADVTMQTFTETMLPDGGEMRLVDERDGKYYNVKKLADGNVWMTENLRLGDSEPMTLTPEDSDVVENFELPATIETLSASDFSTYDTKNVYLDNTYGGYYNFYTATAGDGTSTKTYGDLRHSICPRGWRLPTGNAGGEYSGLYTKYNSSALMRGDPGITLAGNIASGIIYSRGEYGSYWSSSVIDSNYGYSLFLNASNVLGTSYTGNKLGGFSVRCIARRETMQKYDTTELENVGDSIKLADERDGKYYNVKKLADGNVWMVENLRLGKSTSMTLTPSDSDVSSNYTLPAAISTLSSSNFSTQNTSEVYVDNNYGGYYSFHAASASAGGTGFASGNVTSSICPKGWRLPTGGSSSDYANLYSQYGNSTTLMQGEPGLVLSGSVYRGSVDSQGVGGFYWSSTVHNANTAHALALDSTMDYFDYKYIGFAIRCIARPPSMQNYDTTKLKNVGDTIDLVDERDGNVYTVKKLADGKVWMTENLRIINKTISSADSNLQPGETWTVPASNASTFTFSQNVNSAYYDATYGGYYSFYAATAGGGGTGMTSGTVSKDICPKGWRLPVGGENSEYEALYSHYNSSSLMMGEPGFVLSGDVNHGRFEGAGSGGVYWTATNANANYAYRLNISASNVSPNQEDDKFTGHAVRCVSRL